MFIIFSCSEGDFVEKVESRTSPKDLNMRTMMLKGVKERTTDTITCSRSDRRGSLKRCSGYNKKHIYFAFLFHLNNSSFPSFDHWCDKKLMRKSYSFTFPQNVNMLYVIIFNLFYDVNNTWDVYVIILEKLLSMSFPNIYNVIYTMIHICINFEIT